MQQKTQRTVYTLFIALLLHTSISFADDKQIAPKIQALSLTDNKALDLSRYKGKVVYLDFWASWCPPCAKSFPALNRLYGELKSQGFEIIAISVDKEQQDLEKFLQKFPVDFTIAWDVDAVTPARYQIQTMPSGYLIDQQGMIRYAFSGFRDGHEQKIKQHALALLKE